MTLNELQKFAKLLGSFNDLDPKMQVATVLALVEVAMSDLKSGEVVVQDIGKKMGLSSGSSTRNVYYWEEGYKGETGGYKYVYLKVSTKDRRRRTIHLTPVGRAFINDLGD